LKLRQQQSVGPHLVHVDSTRRCGPDLGRLGYELRLLNRVPLYIKNL